MTTLTTSADQVVVLRDIAWTTYEALVSSTRQRAERICYDQGVLEIMSPSRLHETTGKWIGRLVELYLFETEIDVESVKSTTFRREDCQRGFEADESYYIQHAHEVRGLAEIDMSIHPAPDLVIEIDISHSSVSKFAIYAELGVSEVWRYDGESLHVYVNEDETRFIEVDQSRVLPQFPVHDVPSWIEKAQADGEFPMLKAFQAEVRRRISGNL